MARKQRPVSRHKRPASLQEEVIHALSQRILGRQALFLPELYGNSKEPADVAWVANRCAVLMYMTEGTGSFEKKFRHNIAQLHRWLRAWKAGQPLIGFSGKIYHKFYFDDIDHVIGLSVVDGGETGCKYHPEQVAYSSTRKLSACATVTGSVMRALAHFAPTARDFLFWLTEIQRSPARFATPEQVIQEIRDRSLAGSIIASSEFQHLQKDVAYHENAVIETLAGLEWLRSNSVMNDAASAIASDLTWQDILWLCAAYSALETQIAPPGKFGAVVAHAKRMTDIYTLQCLTCARSDITAQNIQRTIDDRPGIAIVTSLDFGRCAPLRMITVSPRSGSSLLQKDASKLREVTLPTNVNP